MNCIYYLPLIGFLIGLSTVLINVLIIRSKLKKLKLESEVDELLDRKLDDVIDGLQDLIPMGGSFITDILQEKIKDFGKGKILDMMPELKEKISKRLESRGKDILLLLVANGGIGAILGTIAMILMLLWC